MQEEQYLAIYKVLQLSVEANIKILTGAFVEKKKANSS